MLKSEYNRPVCFLQGELNMVFQHYTPTDEGGVNLTTADVTSKGGKGTGKRRKNETEDPPFSSIEVTNPAFVGEIHSGSRVKMVI